MPELFDEESDVYDDWYRTPKGKVVDAIEKEAVYRYLTPEPGMQILDVGCGTGNLSMELARLGARVVGIDISEPMLARARFKAESEGIPAEFFRADVRRLPFGDDIFDAVVSVTALEFVPDLRAALLEAYRVLKPGGQLVVGVIGGNSTWSKYYREKAAADPQSLFRHARFPTLEELLLAMPGERVQGKAVLFVPPDFDFTQREEAFALEQDAVRGGRKDGGFLCALSYKTAPNKGSREVTGGDSDDSLPGSSLPARS